MSSRAFNRNEMIEPRPAPAGLRGLNGMITQIRRDGPFQALLSVLSILIMLFIAWTALSWVLSPTWEASSLRECRDIVGVNTGKGCWGVIRERWYQLLVGSYPVDQVWRVVLATLMLIVGLGLFLRINSTAKQRGAALLMSAATPYLLWGGGLWTIVLILLAIAVGVAIYRLWSSEGAIGAAEILAVIGGGAFYWWVSPYVLGLIVSLVLLVAPQSDFLLSALNADAPWIWQAVMIMLSAAAALLIYGMSLQSKGGAAAMLGLILGAVFWWFGGAYGPEILPESIASFGLTPVASRDFGGFLLAIVIGLSAIVFSLPLGILLALGRGSSLRVVRFVSIGFIETIRGVPLITLLFIASTLLNIFLPPGTNFDIVLRVIIMATLFTAAYIAEIIRGAFAAIPKGQTEGAASLGLNYWMTQQLIILPQALKISIPSIVSQFILMFKDTTLVSIIGLFDPLKLSQNIAADSNWTGIVWEIYGFAAVIFFILCFAMSQYSVWLEEQLRTEHR